MSKTKAMPDYPRKQAASLICACYNSFGATLDRAGLDKSVLENSIGELPESWNVGLFRFLDEAIYLFRVLSYFSDAAALNSSEHRAQMILCHQVDKNLCAIRILASSGLDGSARQNVRALYEMCHSFSRCLVDPEFSEAFANQSTFESANEFWHQFVAKSRTEKFLIEYNKSAATKCLLVVSDELRSAHQVLGVGTHPNFIGWLFDWEKEISDAAGMEKMFHFSSDRATELVLFTTCQLAFLTLDFVSGKIADISVSLGLLTNNPAFQHYESDLEALRGVGKVSGLMFLMLVKLMNRNKTDFDPAVRF